MSFNPQALNERTLKQFVDRLHKLRKDQACPQVWPPKRSAIQEEIAHILGFTSWHHAISAVRPLQPNNAPTSTTEECSTSSPTYPQEPAIWSSENIGQFLEWATENQGASDIIIGTDDQIRLEVCGRSVLASKRVLTQEEVNAIITFLYSSDIATSVISDNKDVDFTFTLPNRYILRINVVGVIRNGRKGTQISIRTIPHSPPKLSVIYPELDDTLREALFLKTGINVISGQSGSGKSTLMSALVQEMLATHENKKVAMYEAPVEFDLSRINIGPHNSLAQTDISGWRGGYADAIRNAMRRNLSDIVLEIREKSTIDECLMASKNGHHLWAIMNSYGVADTINRLMRVFDYSEVNNKFVEIITNTNAVICQSLVPTVDGGRTALRETLVLDEEAKNMLFEVGMENIASGVMQLLTERKSTFFYDAERKYSQGLIPMKVLEGHRRWDREKRQQ